MTTMAAAPEQRPLRRPPPPAAAIRVLDTVLVHPTSSESSGLAAPPGTSLPLTFFDIFWINAPPVQRVFFYRLEPGADVDAIVSNLRKSLSHALGKFFPLAGKLWLAPGTANRYELHYCSGDAVTFTIADSDDDVDSLAADSPRQLSHLAPLVPRLPEGGAVLAVQATVLQSARGLAVGVTVHHAACDGAASTHFLHTWAATAAGARPLPNPPVIDRTLIADPTGLYDIFCPKSAAPSTEDTNTNDLLANDHVFATFVLSRAHLQRVKDLVAAEAATRGVTPPPRCSSLVAAFGFVWSCYHRAKPVDSDGNKTTCLLFPVDYRSRLTPPVPEKYFGNCVGAAIAFASKPELVGTDGLWTACTAVAASIEEAVSTETKMDRLGERVMEAVVTGMVTVAGSPRFKVYELDFGFGRPAKVDIVSVAKTGAIAVAESRASDGGMEVGVCLTPDGMAAFRKCFDDAVAELDLQGTAVR